jgi:hypothetical protein
MKSDMPFHQIKLCDTHQRSDRDISTRPLALETLLFPLDSLVHQVCNNVTRVGQMKYQRENDRD